MRKTKSRQNRKKRGIGGGPYLHLLKCALTGCVLSVVLVLILALTLKWNLIQESAVITLSSAIKAVCAVLVGLLCANGAQKRGWLMAGIGGCVYILIAYIAFSAVERVFAFNMGLIADIAMGFVAGVAGSMLLKVKENIKA